MKEELQERLVSSLDNIQEYIEATEEFVVEQAPLVAQEIISLGRHQALFGICGWVLSATVMTSLAIFCWVSWWRRGARDEGFQVGSIVASAVAVPLWLGALLMTYTSLVPLLAPRLYLLQEISKLL
jgi:hypothetical protein